MHFEILVEDASGKKLLEALLPKIVGDNTSQHTWRIIGYKGLGRIPPNMKNHSVASNRFLLDQLPRLLKGYGKTYPNGAHNTAIVVVIDCDRNDCKTSLRNMKDILSTCVPQPNTLFRIAIEECEAWILGDIDAVRKAYPKAHANILQRYKQDSICGTWELLADAIYSGGSATLSKKPYFEIGKTKSEWAEQIGPLINIEDNRSISFCKFRDGIRRLMSSESMIATAGSNK